MMEKYRVAVYCRVACAEQLGDPVPQAGQREIDKQVNLLRTHIVQNGYGEPACYADNGYSGSRLDGRPGFQQLCKDIAAGQVDAVIVRDISRVGRSYLDVAQWLKWLEERGAKLFTLDAPMQGFRAPKK